MSSVEHGTRRHRKLTYRLRNIARQDPPEDPPTARLTRRTSPERASIASLRENRPQDAQWEEAAWHLCQERVILLEDITENQAYRNPDGSLQFRWLYKVAAMDIDEHGALLVEPELNLRPNDSVATEEHEYVEEEERPQRRPHPLRTQAVSEEDEEGEYREISSGAEHDQGGRKEGDVEQAAVEADQDEQDDLESDIRRLL
ncbi:hypothetical protein N0V90_010531 [Kalmusia sp. IMI 367209]|nr:hypothetical protein N0V90_010531 [Kalmusia sp. IMI 367209]